MNILITGAKGFVGKNLTETLKNIRDGKNCTRPCLSIGELYLYDADTDPALLAPYCEKCDFVFHLAGVNRPKNDEEFRTGNVDLTEKLLSLLRKAGNVCPVMISSSIQASLSGRFSESVYGRSKADAERLLFDHEKETGAKALVFRLPNLFGKWSRPDYNSVVATYCYRISRGMPITVSDPEVRLQLLYIDDLVDTLLDALEGRVCRCRPEGADMIPDESGVYCYAAGAHSVRLGEIVDLLNVFAATSETITMPELPKDSFEKKLFSTYLSFLPPEQAAYGFTVHEDERGSFTELIKTINCGQFSVNVSKPGITKGQHWHNSKWEIFIVVSGEALIRQRNIGTQQVYEFRVFGSNPTAVRMLPGYTHSIINLSEDEDLVTLMWANEIFDQNRPDTYFEPV